MASSLYDYVDREAFGLLGRFTETRKNLARFKVNSVYLIIPESSTYSSACRTAASSSPAGQGLGRNPRAPAWRSVSTTASSL